ncbi:MAG: hypothetical protein H8E40_03445 [Chloroflexi bacterium]|nr:hypothetical protein [Chloroflexota bacterium]MBL7061875.1 hypothetical protein [Dehalococcoidia bacterium]
MQTGSFLTQATDILESDARLRQVKVAVFTETCTLTGHTYCMKFQRLLDALNQDFIPNSLPIGKDFMPLTEVEMSFPSLKREFMTSIFVRKASILFVGEKSEHQPKMPETEDSPKIYPMRTKNPIGAEVHMPLYALTGQMYAEVWQKLLDAVDRADKFIPLTNVGIHPTLNNTALTFDFVAVNRDKIIYLGEYLEQTKATIDQRRSSQDGLNLDKNWWQRLDLNQRQSR